MRVLKTSMPWRYHLHSLARFREGEPPGEPRSHVARTEPRPPRITKAHLERGAAAAEFALLAPFLAFILLIAVDFCRLLFAYNTITNSARNGALWASDPLANGTVTPSQSPYASVQAAALADANNLNPALTPSNITQTSGTDGQGNATVVVTVQYPFTLFTSYLGFNTATLSRQVTMRVAPVTPY